MGKVFVGHDWAETHHDVFVGDDTGQKLATARLSVGVGGVRRFHEIIAGLVDDPGEVLVASETDRGLFVSALVAAGCGGEDPFACGQPVSPGRMENRRS